MGEVPVSPEDEATLPSLPGLLATPTVLANVLLSFTPDRSTVVRGRDRVGVVSPMFNEEPGARAALTSLLRQSVPFDELAISVNGGTDDTLAEIQTTLGEHGFGRVYSGLAPGLEASLERWYAPNRPAVTVLSYLRPISKSDSINAVIAGGYLTTERVLVIDGDTIFDRHFLANLRDNFYRLTVSKKGGKRRYVITDSALQSGSVMSARPEQGQPVAGIISRARSAEYVVSAVLRSGQTARLGAGQLFGSSRLYTVVGCGFVAKRDRFPMPADTLTEDHDFTLSVQNGDAHEETVGVATLAQRGFTVVVDGEELHPSAFFDEQDEIVLRHSSDARFVTSALMYTEDPPHLSGYIRQVERWNGGGIENALKRVLRPRNWQALRPNVRFTVLAAQLENLMGVALLLIVLPLAFGLNFALPGYGTPLRAIGWWLASDLIFTSLLVLLGFSRLWRGQGRRGFALFVDTAGSTLRSVPSFLLFRFLNVVTLVTAATREVPKFLRHKEQDPRVTITWARPRAVKKGRHVRTVGVAGIMVLTAFIMFVGMAYVAGTTRPGYKTTWQLINASPPVLQNDHRILPIQHTGQLLDEVVEAGLTAPPEDLQVVSSPEPSGISAFCSVGFTARPAAEARTLDGDVASYAPLSYWERLVLARLAPLAAHIEEASTAYDIPADLLLRVLLNESYLDPLAVGPTEDLGLAQVTSDALTLLRAFSTDELSPLANKRFFAEPFSVFDPDFSICAGAAKLAWARSQPGGHDDAFAYARYINPLEGVVRGAVSPIHAELVPAIDELKPLTAALMATIAAYRVDPGRVTPDERALLDVSREVAIGQLSIRDAYFTVATLSHDLGIADSELYDQVLDLLYDTRDVGATGPVPAAAPVVAGL